MPKVIIIAKGRKAEAELKSCAATLPKRLQLVTDTSIDAKSRLTVVQQAHEAKTKAYALANRAPAVLLDADTRVKDKDKFQLGFKILEAGWELVMVPSFPVASRQVLWNLTQREREYTLNKLGRWRMPMLNTGVMYFRNSPYVKRLFDAWNTEWLRFKDRDQGAFLRALQRNPVRLWLLGKDFNSAGGAVVDHLFGRAE